MRTRILSLSTLILLVAFVADADEPTPTPVVATSRPAPPQPVATPVLDRRLSKVEHLRRAAHHLEAAGADDLARDIREEADSMLEVSVEELNQKREQLNRLQSEIAELEELTGCNQQIMLTCRVADIDLHKLRNLGLDIHYLLKDDSGMVQQFSNGNHFSGGIDDTGKIDVILGALTANGTAKILAEPVLITTNGRPANLQSGGEFPVLLPDGSDEATIEYREFGLRLEAVPEVLGDGRVRLDIAPELATRDFENAVTVNGTVVPGLHVRRINTQVEMEFGETVTLVMPAPGEVEKVRQASGEDGVGDDIGTVTIVCVTPERIRPIYEQPVPLPQPAPENLQAVPAY